MHRNQSVNVHQFAMVPKAEIPRSSFRIQKAHKTTFDAGMLIPFYVNEILPGDSFNLKATVFARMATPLFPIMDNMVMDTFWFFVPNRTIWTNWVKLQGQQENPGDSVDFTIPQLVSPAGGFAALSIYDYMGLPTAGQMAVGATVSVNALPLRAYNKIYNDWFRDQNLVNSVINNTDDGPDAVADFTLLRRGKRHDYFTSCLPFLQKGAAVTMPLGGTAPVVRVSNANQWGAAVAGSNTDAPTNGIFTAGGGITSGSSGVAISLDPAGGLVANLAAATAATINQIRLAFQMQRMLERDARGGTRYNESLMSRWGVTPRDQTLQRAEFLGSGSFPVNISPIAQTSATTASGTDTPQGNLAAMGTITGRSGFSHAFTEHGFVIGVMAVRADLTYQQGLRKMWSRRTRVDHFEPVFSHLGEQAVLSKEIYCTGEAADENVWGYQERWGEYRYDPSMITGLFRSTTTGTIDNWHLAQRFTSRPTLNATFIGDAPPLERVIAVGAEANGQQFIFDSFIDAKASRCMPMYSVPGMIDRF